MIFGTNINYTIKYLGIIFFYNFWKNDIFFKVLNLLFFIYFIFLEQ